MQVVDKLIFKLFLSCLLRVPSQIPGLEYTGVF